MKKILLSILFVLILGLTLVSAATSVLQALPITPVSGNPGETVSIDVKVKNNGADTIDVVNVVSSDLEFGVNKITAPGISPITSLGAGQTKTTTVRINIPAIIAGGYIGTLEISDASDTGTEPKSITYLVNVNSVADLNVLTFDGTTALEITGQEDEIRTTTFQIKNNGSVTYTPQYSFDQNDFSDGDKIVSISFSEGEIKPGETKTITLTVDIENKIDIGTYDGLITVTGGSANDVFKLAVRVHPEVCKDGPVGDELRLDINEPDNGDDFAPGDTINIDVNVENDGSRKDVIVEAFLYNVDEDDEVERVESDSERIGSNEDTDFELDLGIPFDSDISEDDEYILFIKAFEDGDEDKHCVEEQIDMNIERKTNDVMIQKITLTPSSAKPGEFVDVAVSIINIGSKDESDVFVTLTSNELRWDETSTTIDLDSGESKDNDAVLRFNGLLVPRDTKAGSYSINAVVNFDDGDEQNDAFVTFTVLEGAVVVDEEDESSLKLQSVSDNGDNAFTASVVVNNNGLSSKTYDLSVDASWAQAIATQTFSVNGGDNRIVQILIKAKDNTETGSYTGVITLKEEGKVIQTKTFEVAVTGKEEISPVTGFAIGNLLEGSGSTVLFIIVDIVLIIIAIFFIRLIFKSGSNKKKPAVTEKVKL